VADVDRLFGSDAIDMQILQAALEATTYGTYNIKDSLGVSSKRKGTM
jgi:hypothetical protein